MTLKRDLILTIKTAILGGMIWASVYSVYCYDQAAIHQLQRDNHDLMAEHDVFSAAIQVAGRSMGK